MDGMDGMDILFRFCFLSLFFGKGSENRALRRK